MKHLEGLGALPPSPSQSNTFDNDDVSLNTTRNFAIEGARKVITPLLLKEKGVVRKTHVFQQDTQKALRRRDDPWVSLAERRSAGKLKVERRTDHVLRLRPFASRNESLTFAPASPPAHSCIDRRSMVCEVLSSGSKTCGPRKGRASKRGRGNWSWRSQALLVMSAAGRSDT